MKKGEDGGVACGLCRISLQQACLGFGIADIVHGMLGMAIVVSMMIKKENDVVNPNPREDRISGYTKWLDNKCPWWILIVLAGTFVLEICIGILLSLGATKRNSILCIIWLIGGAFTPMTICLLGLGRIYEWAAVCEFVWKIDDLPRRGFLKRNKYENHGPSALGKLNFEK